MGNVKKTLSLVTVLALSTGILASCESKGKGNKNASNPSSTAKSSQINEKKAEEKGDKDKEGLNDKDKKPVESNSLSSSKESEREIETDISSNDSNEDIRAKLEKAKNRMEVCKQALVYVKSLSPDFVEKDQDTYDDLVKRVDDSLETTQKALDNLGEE